MENKIRLVRAKSKNALRKKEECRKNYIKYLETKKEHFRMSYILQDYKIRGYIRHDAILYNLFWNEKSKDAVYEIFLILHRIFKCRTIENIIIEKIVYDYLNECEKKVKKSYLINSVDYSFSKKTDKINENTYYRREFGHNLIQSIERV